MSHTGAMSVAPQIAAKTPAAGGNASGAAGSSFYAAMRLMPKPRREAMFAIYDFCRSVDDIADEPGPTREERRSLLDGWRADVASLYAGTPPERVAALSGLVARYGLDQADFLAVIDGMQMDVEADIRAPTYETLDLSCDRVASAVGRLSVRVFGMRREPGVELAHHLGRALQLTNILRDLDEDCAMGRLYLPREALAIAGIAAREPAEVLAHPGLDRACRFLAHRARVHYQAADHVLKAKPPGSLRTPSLMSAVYGEILTGMETAGWARPRARVKIGRPRLLWLILTRGLIG